MLRLSEEASDARELIPHRGHGIKPPSRPNLLLFEVFRKRALLNTWPLAPSPALAKCSTTLCNNSNRSTMASRVCCTDRINLSGRWKSAKMPARYTDRQTADRGPVARYYRRAEVNITGSCRQRRSESITGAYTHRGAYHERSRPLPGFLSRNSHRRPHGGIGGATQATGCIQCCWEVL